jgi:hypothetical protein
VTWEKQLEGTPTCGYSFTTTSAPGASCNRRRCRSYGKPAPRSYCCWLDQKAMPLRLPSWLKYLYFPSLTVHICCRTSTYAPSRFLCPLLPVAVLQLRDITRVTGDRKRRSIPRRLSGLLFSKNHPVLSTLSISFAPITRERSIIRPSAPRVHVLTCCSKTPPHLSSIRSLTLLLGTATRGFAQHLWASCARFLSAQLPIHLDIPP